MVPYGLHVSFRNIVRRGMAFLKTIISQVSFVSPLGETHWWIIPSDTHAEWRAVDDAYYDR